MTQDATRTQTRALVTNESPRPQMTAEQLEKMIGGLAFNFKQVAVKTISWYHDDE